MKKIPHRTSRTPVPIGVIGHYTASMLIYSELSRPPYAIAIEIYDGKTRVVERVKKLTGDNVHDNKAFKDTRQWAIDRMYELNNESNAAADGPR